MLLNLIRAMFVLMVAGVALNYAELHRADLALPSLIMALGVASLVIAIDIFIPQKSLLAMSGMFFGLVIGMVVAFGVGIVLDLLVDAYQPVLARTPLISTTKVLIGIVTCYLAVSFILQTKDDVRFVIPYVEFAKQRKGQHPLILDTSVIIDGRIADILETWTVDAPVLVPRFVLHELHLIADSGDRLKRNRGRRGLDVVNRLQANQKIEVQLQDTRESREDIGESVDHQLVTLARKIDGRVVTNDYNLNKVATIRGVEVVNINDLANALKPVFLPGEGMKVKIIRPGEGAGQGVGYLEDGTMVVVESGKDRIGETVPIMVTSVLQTSAGRMVFGRIEGAAPGDRPQRRT